MAGRARRARRGRQFPLAWMAWLVVALAASLPPFLVEAYARSGPWNARAGGGSVRVWQDRSHQPLSNIGRPHPPELRWRPAATSILAFDAGWTSSYRTIELPPWLVLLVPTLAALGLARRRRTAARRRLTRLGRTPCPACHYDMTDLTTCPECGAATPPDSEPHR